LHKAGGGIHAEHGPCCLSAGGILPEYDRLAELAMKEPWWRRQEAAAKELKMARSKKTVGRYGPSQHGELLRKAEEMA